MTQAISYLLAIFAPLGSLTRVLEAVLRYVGHIDAILRDPEEDAETESREGRVWLESAIAMGEHWINIVIAARTVELLGLRHAKKYYAIRWSGWKPSVPRSIGCLLQRYERMRASLFMIDRLARRRAARIRAEMREAYLVEAAAHPQADDAIFSSVIFCLEVSRAVILRAANLPIRAPP